MKKKWKIFFAILYYVLTFSLGVFIAIALPTANRDIQRYKFINQYIDNGELYKAVDLMCEIYNKDTIYENKENEVYVFETMFPTTVLVEGTENETKTVYDASYVFIIRNLQREWFEKNSDNLSIVKINGDKKINILNSDLDGDGNFDTIASLIDSHYICFSVNKLKFDNVSSMELVNMYGETIFKITDLTLNYSSEFFNEGQSFITKYNEFNSDGKISTEENQELENIYKQLNEKNNNYQKIGSYSLDEINDIAIRDSVSFVLIYFIWVYILGDFIVGKRYIWRFIKWLFKKIKNKIKPEKEKEEPLALGKNFFSLVTFEIETPEDFAESVVINYEHEENSAYNFKCVITKGSNYSKQERIHGGVYKLTSTECDGYVIIDLPEQLEVKGYKKTVSFVVRKEN